MANIQTLLDQISQLQTTEEQLYNVLTRNAEKVALGHPSIMTDVEIKNITTQINTLTATRVNLYNTLALNYQHGVVLESSVKKSITQQTNTLRLLEKELNKSKENLAKIKDEKYNQLKMIQINSYFSKQYDAHVKLMKLITVVGLCMLATLILRYIPPLKIASTPLFNIVTIIGILFIMKILIDMYMRKGDNYDEYTWPVGPTNDKELSSANANSTDFIDISGIDIPFCLGANCCSTGTIWDDTTSTCVIDKTKII
jgi:hypothetical protein